MENTESSKCCENCNCQLPASECTAEQCCQPTCPECGLKGACVDPECVNAAQALKLANMHAAAKRSAPFRFGF